MGFENAPAQPPSGDEEDRVMTPEEIELEDRIISNWWEDMLDGKKPCSEFDTTWEVTDEYLARAREKGLEIIRYQAHGQLEAESPIDGTTVAWPGKFSDLISAEKLQRFRELRLGDRLDKVLGEIGDKSIAEAMVYLDQYERKDEEYNLGPYNAERPEIAALTGLGLGYPACCVEYYVRTNYLGGELYPDEQADPRWGYGLCSEHAERERQRRQQPGGGQ